MNEAEAMTVAEEIINHALTNATYEVKSVNNNEVYGTFIIKGHTYPFN
jgi:hypothetical protein